MKKFLIGASALLATVTGVVGAAAPAQAAPWHGGYGYRGGWHGGYGYRGAGWGGAVVAGLAGLAVGSALSQTYHYGPGYYYGPPPAYYAGPAYYGYYGGCHRQWVWTRWGYRIVHSCY